MRACGRRTAISSPSAIDGQQHEARPRRAPSGSRSRNRTRNAADAASVSGGSPADQDGERPRPGHGAHARAGAATGVIRASTEVAPGGHGARCRGSPRCAARRPNPRLPGMTSSTAPPLAAAVPAALARLLLRGARRGPVRRAGRTRQGHRGRLHGRVALNADDPAGRRPGRPAPAAAEMQAWAASVATPFATLRDNAPATLNDSVAVLGGVLDQARQGSAHRRRRREDDRRHHRHRRLGARQLRLPDPRPDQLRRQARTRRRSGLQPRPGVDQVRQHRRPVRVRGAAGQGQGRPAGHRGRRRRGARRLRQGRRGRRRRAADRPRARLRHRDRHRRALPADEPAGHPARLRGHRLP